MYFKIKNMYYKTLLSILAKSLIISFQYNSESVYFLYSNPVSMVHFRMGGKISGRVSSRFLFQMGRALRN